MHNDFYTQLLSKYVQNPSSFENNFDLGNYYYSIGQTATAVSFYLRAAERTNLARHQYECMLKAGTCFALQGTRNNSVTGMYQHAIALMPTRPEGYFLLSRFYERTEQWFLGYTFASIGWNLATEDHPPLLTDVEYPGKYGLLFEKAVTGWWCGLCDESRELFKEVLYKYPIEESYKESCINNLKFLNSWKTPEQFPSAMNTREIELVRSSNE
jgi:tetratricopeptide (TPR) repeat protein